jgi:tetratricopeptide (TPR) repeat protein
MKFDPHNKIVKLCVGGMDLEAINKEEAAALFQQAWNEAANDFERLKSAHYVARHQDYVADKLKWDQTALNLVSKINDETVKESYPSLYLNIAKCFEDLKDFDNARNNYQLALSYTDLLPENGYGNMIKGGIMKGIERVKA